MKIFLSAIVAVVGLCSAAVPQTFLSQIRVGQKLPAVINQGGYTEIVGGAVECQCNCRVFNIFEKPSNPEYGVLVNSYLIHYTDDSTVVGIVEKTLRMSYEDALICYVGSLSYFIDTLNSFKNRKFIRVRDTGKDYVVDGEFYCTYYDSTDGTYTSFGIAKSTLIKETYTKDSCYQPRFIH